MTLPCLLLALFIGGITNAADRKKAMPEEDVVDFPAVGQGLCVSNIFQGNMVLERDKPLNIWGWADPGEEVIVSFAGQQAQAQAAADRSWQVTLKAMPANSAPQAMTVKGKSLTLTLENILVGDVWLLGGQSNMAFPISKVDDGELEIVSANFPQIRLLALPQGKGFKSVRSFERLDEWSAWSHRHFRRGDWNVCSPETVKEFSAIGYVFGRRLFMASRVPIGLIDTSIGGTTVETWTPEDLLRKIDGKETRELLKGWDDKIAAFDPQADLKKRIESHNANNKKPKSKGQSVPADLRPGPAADRNRPGFCYAGVIKPLGGLAIKGAVFHQGYNNCFGGSAGARMYYQVFGKMIAAWRETFRDPRMPFCIISLCTASEPQTPENYLKPMYDAGPYIREAQYKTFRDLYDAGDKNVGFVSSFDQRKSFYHPQIKIPVGERAAKWALATQYGLLTGGDADEYWLPPAIEEVKIVAGTIRLTMSTATKMKDESTDKLVGFAIAGNDRRFYPADVDWYSDGTKDNRKRPVQSRNILVLSSPFVPQPLHYRYAWARNPMANITNSRQVPLAAQRSDDWLLEETPERIPTLKDMPEDAARRDAAGQIRKALELADIERRIEEAKATIAKLKPAVDKAKADAEKKKRPGQSHSANGSLPVPRRGFVSTTFAETWEQGLIGGNGTIGVNVLSRPLDETIIFTHARMYLPSGAPTPPPDTASRLGEMRQLIDRGLYRDAYLKGLEISGRSDFRYPDAFVPAFDMRIETSAEGKVRDFLRSVDFQTGVATVHWTDDRGAFERRIFVSRADNVAVLKITGPGKGTIGCTMKLTATRPSPKLREGLVNGSNEIFASHVSDVRATADANHLTFTSRFTRAYPGSVQSLDGVARIVAPGAAIGAEGDTTIIRNADRVVALVSLEPVHEVANSRLDAIERALDKIDPDYDRLLERHAALHGGMFNRMRLDIGGGADRQLPTERLLEMSNDEHLSHALIEKVFDAGRYNIISCTGEMPPNLQGIWAGTYKSYWSGGFTQNGNLPTAIAALLRGNTPELMLAYTRYIESLVPCLRVNARHIFGARGLVLPAHTSVHGYSLLPLGYGGSNWTTGAAWASHFFHDYYLYTGDRKFLAEHALPFMAETALFFEDFLHEGPDGKYVFNPSDSPENTPSNSTTHISFNATMDVAAVKELLGNLIEASRTLGINREKVTVWEKMLTKLPDYLYNEQGMVKEWLTPKLDDQLDHRHSSHLYALFDGLPEEIARDPKLREGFRRIIAYKLDHHYQRAGFMAFGISQLGQAATSLGDGELAYQTVVRLVNNYWLGNLASTHNPRSVFNMDISGGLPAVIVKMLLDSSPGEVRLLPALPKQWPVGTLEGAPCRGQIEVETLQWQPGRIRVALRSGKEQTITLTAPARIGLVTVAAGQAAVKDAVHSYTCRVTLPKEQSVALELNLKLK